MNRWKSLKGVALATELLCAATAGLAQGAVQGSKPDAGGITVWKNGVPPGGINEQADFGDHVMMISHREA